MYRYVPVRYLEVGLGDGGRSERMRRLAASFSLNVLHQLSERLAAQLHFKSDITYFLGIDHHLFLEGGCDDDAGEKLGLINDFVVVYAETKFIPEAPLFVDGDPPKADDFHYQLSATATDLSAVRVR